MTLYRPFSPHAESAAKGWSASTFYARFTQRLVAALSAPTAAGTLYEVDLQLRPSGTAGPVAVSLAAFDSYYAREAETWELLALSRARVVWASSPDFAHQAAEAIEVVLRRPRDPSATARAVIDMRALMAAERPPQGFWDLKLGEGGLVDIEFTAQHLQLIHAAEGGPLRQNTGEALEALASAYPARAHVLDGVLRAWRLQQHLSQLLKIALDDGESPEDEPPAFRSLLAKAGGARTFSTLKTRLAASRRTAHAAFESLIKP
jgi:glutamate-ammonia-ligase adenylyltransferase